VALLIVLDLLQMWARIMLLSGGGLQYVNDTGGINGKKIKYTWFDYGYRIPEAITKYNFLKRME